MAVASLSKFTVPLSNDHSSSSQGLLMPKLKYRFRASFYNLGVTNPTTELTKQVVDIKRPNVTFTPITLDVYNSKVYLQGKPEWQETTINFRDDATGQVSKLIGEQIQKQFDFMEQSSAPSGVDYKFRMEFDILDGGNGQTTPVILEQWDLEGCFLSSVGTEGALSPAASSRPLRHLPPVPYTDPSGLTQRAKSKTSSSERPSATRFWNAASASGAKFPIIPVP